MVKNVEIYAKDERLKYPLKTLEFNFPIIKNGHEPRRICCETGTSVEMLVCLSKKTEKHINIDVEFGEGEGQVSLKKLQEELNEQKPKKKTTYKDIQAYIEEKYGFKVHTAYIAEVKRDLGLPMYDAPNAVEELKRPRSHPTTEIVEAIKDALKYFAII